ncbi:phosphoribosyl transferase domain protein [Aspergillus clavatus NRRL 1]|uniref:Phosphoribosyl transferase domain protein n=1 Tax=Aspergillus clavatus (strain ATCC 1007 / CBS 513.65 / DSM 816 / NCTC 3887 / NRRL 1 / QM 1276 / 107) TaxID=344612 RepID=A1CLU9_ASPCL|nr:phosphoribosyl transferase domain protein [Aspergillus clavatus NRRL 1]EAW09078.1 phosphoribosyl transferase domain protein [Aspergillus clavatus NRRL 1]
MATLDALKSVLRQRATTTATATAGYLKQSLSDTQYSAGFDILARESSYHDFIIPQLSQLLAPLFNSRIHISVLEIGPGPKSVLGYLPRCLRQKVTRYTAFESNGLFATKLEEWLCPALEAEPPFPCLERPPDIHRIPFALNSNRGSGTDNNMGASNERFDIVLFCHSMYGMRPKDRFIKQALDMLVQRPDGGMVVVFHRNGALHVDGLVCQRMASHPTGTVCVADDDEALDNFATFIAGYVVQDTDANRAIRDEWREVCRTLGRRDEAYPSHLLFSSPNVMAIFTKQATTLPELTAQVPLVKDKIVKNREALLQRSAAVVRPTEVRHVQQCVQWALKHGVGLAVIGGGHSGHCLWSNVVSVDMGAFDQLHILPGGEDGEQSGSGVDSLVVAEAGCKTGDIISKTMAAGITVPLGSRPSVGAGLWLQGGIGHLARLHGLACDAIVGAVVVSVDSGDVLYIGCVPSQHRPAGAVRPKNETDFLWALKGAGTNFGIVVSVTFKAYTAPIYSTRDWIIPLGDGLDARLKLRNFDESVASKLPRHCSADAYLYWDSAQLHLGVTMFESSTTKLISETPLSTPPTVVAALGPEDNFKAAIDGVGLFEAEIYMSQMHGGHGGSKTSAFKRCLFLKNIGTTRIASKLVKALTTRPTPLCYLHLLHGGGAIADVADDSSAFGCRDWDFACVVTGVWLRNQDGTEVAQAAKQWVYDVARDLLPVSTGAYSTDLGPDPRDAALAAKAFGPNRPRLARLKHNLDPHNVLAYACPLPETPVETKLIILVTGDSCAGKDYCAEIWVSAFTEYAHKRLTARSVSISDATKREYAAQTGADLNRLIRDRAYKEQHRPALTSFFQDQVQHRPQLLQEHFLDVVHGAVDVDVLLITGMRDEAPVAGLSHLVPDSRLLDVRVQASEETRRARRGCCSSGDDRNDNKDSNNGGLNPTALDYRPSFIFKNDAPGDEAAKKLAEERLLPFFHEDLQRLASMVRSVPDFPRPGINFRHVLDISQQPGGLALCTSLLQSHFMGEWAKVDVIASCEAGGFVYASALALRVDVPLALIREAGRLPPPTVSVLKPTSHISSSVCNGSGEKSIEIDRDLIPRGASVVVVDDVLATGKTLRAVLQLLEKANIKAEDVSVIVVVEFPVHRGREFLRQHGFGRVNIQSLLVFGGA